MPVGRAAKLATPRHGKLQTVRRAPKLATPRRGRPQTDEQLPLRTTSRDRTACRRTRSPLPSSPAAAGLRSKAAKAAGRRRALLGRPRQPQTAVTSRRRRSPPPGRLAAGLCSEAGGRRPSRRAPLGRPRLLQAAETSRRGRRPPPSNLAAGPRPSAAGRRPLGRPRLPEATAWTARLPPATPTRGPSWMSAAIRRRAATWTGAG
mmetsp:Transcript_6826/g.21586  ORF Transcript_6826/g.21586 Transcript_6826/m.21586 type:complete len:205 (+) Transcript_6826:781-1395(+)